MNRKPTVCQVLHGLGVGGAEVLATRMARRLWRRYRFVFACLDDLGTLAGPLRDEGFPVEVVGRRSGLDGRCARRLADLFRRERVDLVHTHQYTPFFYAALARQLYRRPPILFTEHGRHFPDVTGRKRRIVNRLLLERRDRVVAVGGAVREALIRNEGIPADRIEVVHNGIDLARFSSAAVDRQATRLELGIGRDDLVAILVARLDPLKDHATAIRAFARVVGRRPDAHLLLVGDGPERDAIRARIAEAGLEQCVRMLGQRDDVPRLLGASDLALLTSRSEGIPLTLLEAMAAGLPIVATDVGGVGEVVEPGVTGFLVPAGDDGAIADRMLAVSQPGGDSGVSAARSRERAAERFGEDAMIHRYDAIYSEQLGARRAWTRPRVGLGKP